MKTTAYRLITDMSDEVRNMSHQRDLVKENYEINSLVRSKTGVKTTSLKVKFAQFSLGWMEHLSTTAKVFLLDNLFTSIKEYNLLWHFPTSSKRAHVVALKELVDTKVLFRTEVPGMYLLNPLKVWRGTVFSSIECTKELLRNDKPNSLMVRDLRVSDKYLLRNGEEQMDHLENNGITPNLLHDGEPGYPLAEA